VSSADSWLVFLAAFGGGLAGAAALLVVECVRRFWDRRRLEVRAYIGYTMSGEDKKLFCEAVNPSDKPVRIASFGLQDKTGARLWITPERDDQLPHTIEGGSSHTHLVSLSRLVEDIRIQSHGPTDLKWVWYHTQTGKTYRKKLDRKFLALLSNEFDKQARAGDG
jgi:hypothetical protein